MSISNLDLLTGAIGLNLMHILQYISEQFVVNFLIFSSQLENFLKKYLLNMLEANNPIFLLLDF